MNIHDLLGILLKIPHEVPDLSSRVPDIYDEEEGKTYCFWLQELSSTLELTDVAFSSPSMTSSVYLVKF